MASNGTVESFLGKIQECPVCRNRFEEPKVLECSHTFCLKCLLDLRQRQEGEKVSKLTCPTCGRGTEAADEDDVQDLPDDIILSSLGRLTLQDQPVDGQGLDINCQACDEKTKAVSKCMDCNHFLCEECQRAHQRLALMKRHEIYTLSQLRLGKGRKQREEPKCGKHLDQTLRFYCDTCEELVCKICFDLHHGGHHLIGLAEALEKCERDVTGLATTVKKTIAELMRIGVEDVLKSQQKLDAMFEITKTKISEKTEKEIAQLRGEEQRVKQEAEKIYKDRVEMFQRVTAANGKEVCEAGHKLDEVNQMMSQLSCHAVVHLRHRILQQLQTLMQSQRDLIGEQAGMLSSKMFFMDFEELSRDVLPLGKLRDKPSAKPRSQSERNSHQSVGTKEQKWELKTKIQTFGPTQTGLRWACDVGVYSNGDIVVADTAHKRLVQIQPSNSESNGIALDLNCANPVCAVVNKNDQLLTLDGPFVKIFDRKHTYKLVHQFTPGRGPYSKPTCLAVDDDNLIAVGYEKTEISLHRPNGALLRRVPAAMTIENLTASRQRLIFTNWDRKKLVAVDYHGKLVFSVDTTQSMARNWGPAGVCCGEDGSVYLTVCGLGSCCGAIHHFDSNGKHIRCLIEDSCGSPRGIAFSAKGDNLVVAAGNSVHIFHCK